MTTEEALRILAVLKAAYPASYSKITEKEARGIMAVWAAQFHDMPVEIVHMAVQKCISSHEFPPTIAEVKKKIRSLWWEAYEHLNEDIPEGRARVYERICEATREYRYAKCNEPSLSALLDGMDNKLRLGG